MEDTILVDTKGKDYRAGRAAARKAIKLGVPRWTTIGKKDLYKSIDDGTGLPIINFGSMSDEIEAFAAGANDEILKGISEGLVKVDFRPLLLSKKELDIALEKGFVGVLSRENSSLKCEGVFSAKLRSEKVRKMYGVSHDPCKRNVFIELTNSHGQVFKDFGLFDSPVCSHSLWPTAFS